MRGTLLRLSVIFGAVALSACSVELQHDLTEDDANDIYVLLQRNAINATKDKDEGEGNEVRYKISVAKADVASAAQLLRDYSLPRPRADGLSVFKKMKGMIPTQTEERAMFIESLGGEVSNALNRYPGVLEARTIVMIPEVSDLTQPDKKPLPSASVFIKWRLVEGKQPLDEKAVRSFVAAAVPEMKPDAVNVLMIQAPKPENETSAEDQWVTILTLRMTKSSAEQFKIMVAAGALLLLAMAALTAFSFVRGGSSNGNGRSNGNGGARKRTTTEG